MHKIKYFAVIVSIILILPVFCVSAFASTGSGFSASLADLDDSLTDIEEQNLREVMQTSAQMAKCNIGIVITDDLNGMTDVRFADEFGDAAFGKGSSFVVLLLLNTNGNPAYAKYEDRISTSGMGRDKYDGHIKAMFNTVYDGLDSHGFYAACKNFCSAAERYGSGSGGTSDKMYDSDNIMESFSLFFGGAFIGLVIAIIVTIVVVSNVVRGYKKRAPISASNYIDQSRTRITRQVDQFVREYTTSVSTSSSSGGHGGGGHGGGGGSHRSGGHGGGGGRHR